MLVLKHKAIYHITHVDNLAQILSEGCLWCEAEKNDRRLAAKSIAYEELKTRRANRSVTVAAGGTLCDYVPFYFANRSPMLYAIYSGYVSAYTGGQQSIIYLVSTVDRIVKDNRDFCFTDGHAVEAMTNFYDSFDDLAEVDWNLIDSWSWRNIASDNDRKRRKQAEFLVHRCVPWECIESIGVIDNKQRDKVSLILADYYDLTPMRIERKWYYD
jgi:hypothetical protein